MTATNEPEVLAKQLWLEVEKKDAQVLNGEVVELAELETKLRAFCTMLEGIQAEDAKRFEPDLTAIMEKLVAWTEAMDKKKSALFKDIQALNSQGKAQAAYRKRNP